jgi:hypothetical protein
VKFHPVPATAPRKTEELVSDTSNSSRMTEKRHVDVDK